MRILDDVRIALKNLGPAKRILEVCARNVPERIAFLDAVADLRGVRRSGRLCAEAVRAGEKNDRESKESRKTFPHYPVSALACFRHESLLNVMGEAALL